MPSNTFQHLGTTTISGTSTSTVTFTSLGGYERLMIIGNFAATTSGNGIYGYINSTGSHDYNTFSATQNSSNNGVPVGNLASSQNYTYFHSPIVNGDDSTGALHLTIFRDGNGYTYITSKYGQYKNTGGELRIGTTRKVANITSFSLVMDPGFFTNGSVISAYGLG